MPAIFSTQTVLRIAMVTILLMPVRSACQQEPDDPTGAQKTGVPEIENALHLPYEELFDRASGFSFYRADLETVRKKIESSRQSCENRAKTARKKYEKLADRKMEEIKKAGSGLADEERHEKHARFSSYAPRQRKWKSSLNI